MAQEPSSSTSKNRRAFIRRRPRGKVKVSCFKGDFDLGENLAVGLADIAECGVLLLLKASVDKGQAVTLLLEGRGHMRAVKAQGRVVWCLPVEKAIYRVGVRLEKYLRYQDVQKIT